VKAPPGLGGGGGSGAPAGEELGAAKVRETQLLPFREGRSARGRAGLDHFESEHFRAQWSGSLGRLAMPTPSSKPSPRSPLLAPPHGIDSATVLAGARGRSGRPSVSPDSGRGHRSGGLSLWVGSESRNPHLSGLSPAVLLGQLVDLQERALEVMRTLGLQLVETQQSPDQLADHMANLYIRKQP
jgi:hypothetical protein